MTSRYAKCPNYVTNGKCHKKKMKGIWTIRNAITFISVLPQVHNWMQRHQPQFIAWYLFKPRKNLTLTLLLTHFHLMWDTRLSQQWWLKLCMGWVTYTCTILNRQLTGRDNLWDLNMVKSIRLRLRLRQWGMVVQNGMWHCIVSW